MAMSGSRRNGELKMLIITADNLPRFMACNPSRLMGGANPPIDGDDTIRKEGNAAHWLVQQVNSGQHTVEELIDRKAPNGIYITSEMVEYLEEYLKTIFNAQIEVDTSHSGANWQINGRADNISYDPDNKILHVRDLKYGWSIVEPDMHWTLISHALGWFIANPDKEVISVKFTIYQPRPHHQSARVRSWYIDVVTLNNLYIQLDTALSNPSDILNTGPNCYRCPALAICPAARKAQMNAIDTSEKAFIDNIDNDNLAFQLDHLKRATEMLSHLKKAYDELATYRIRQGQVVTNYSLETELTNRQWMEHITPEIMTMLTGKDLAKKQLITPAQAEKTGISPDVVTALTERRNKGVKLVRVDAHAKASKLFERK